MMQRQVEALTRLIENIQDASRLCRGKIELHLQDVELSSLIRRAVDLARPAADERGIQLSLFLPSNEIDVNGDAARIGQVMSCLLSNACTFTDRGGQVAVDAQAEGDQAVIRVKDGGVGIPPEKLDAIFDLFVQLDDARSISSRSLGVGLTVVRRLVELHGGTFEAQSEGPGKGSEFIVRLRLRAPAGTPSKPPESERNASTLRILVVDDNRDAADSLAELLGIQGYRVRTAYDGPGALSVAARFRPEVVLCDLKMPNMNGYEVAKCVRRLFQPSDVLLVAVTSYGADDDRRRAREAGFDHHFLKPVDSNALHGVLGHRAATAR